MEIFSTVALLIVTGLIIWTMSAIIPFLQEAIIMRKVVTDIPSLPSVWPMGTFPLVTKLGRESILQFFAQAAYKNKSKLLVFWRTFLIPSIFVVHSETARQILRTAEPKSRRFGAGYSFLLPWLGEGLLVSRGEKWERNRKMLTSAFHFNILQPYVQIYNDATEILMDKIDKATRCGESCEVFGPVSLCTLDVMLRCACSYDDDIQNYGGSHPYVKAVSRLSQLLLERSLNPLMYFKRLYDITSAGRENQRLCNYVHRFAEGIIEKRREALRDNANLLSKRHLDFLDILLTARDEDNVGLSHEDIRAEVDTFLFEGHDTTASAISWSLYALAKYPHVQEKIYEEVKTVLAQNDSVDWDGLSQLKYTTLFLKEVLRMYSPVPTIARMLSKPITIDGTDLPAGTTLTILLYVLHHNPDVWDNPEEFRPERFAEESFNTRDPYSFVPFSAGPRNCIGQNFALNEEKVLISRIVKRFRIQTDPHHEVLMIPSVVMRAKYGIKLKFTARH